MTIRIPKNVLGGNIITTVGSVAPTAPPTGALWYDTGATAVDLATQAELDAAVASVNSGLAAVRKPTIRLDYAAVSDVSNGGTFTAGVWTAVAGPFSFTNGAAAGSWLDIEVILCAIMFGIALTQAAVRLIFGNGIATYPFNTGVARTNTAYGVLNGHTFSYPNNFLPAGANTVTLQIMSLSSNVVVYCRPAGQPNMEALAIRIKEWIP